MKKNSDLYLFSMTSWTKLLAGMLACSLLASAPDAVAIRPKPEPWAGLTPGAGGSGTTGFAFSGEDYSIAAR